MQIGRQKFPFYDFRGSGTNALKVIDYGHHEIHAGSAFSAWAHEDKSIGANFDMLIVTPNTTSWPHLLIALENESEADFLIYEGVSCTSNGTATTVYNSQRNSVTTSGVLVFQYPTALTVGTTTIAGWHSGSGKGAGGSDRSESEIVLKQNTKYLVRVNAVAAGWIALRCHWYDHTFD